VRPSEFRKPHRGQAYFSSLPGVDNTQSNITKASYSPEYITPTRKFHEFRKVVEFRTWQNIGETYCHR
jgi:hypothetical protein